MIEFLCEAFELIFGHVCELLIFLVNLLLLFALIEFIEVLCSADDAALEVKWEFCRCFDFDLDGVKYSEDQVSVAVE